MYETRKKIWICFHFDAALICIAFVHGGTARPCGANPCGCSPLNRFLHGPTQLDRMLSICCRSSRKPNSSGRRQRSSPSLLKFPVPNILERLRKFKRIHLISAEYCNTIIIAFVHLSASRSSLLSMIQGLLVETKLQSLCTCAVQP